MVFHLVNRCITLQLLVMPSLHSSLQVKCPHNNHRILPCNIINVAAGDPWIKKLPAIVTTAGPKNAMSNMTRCRFYMFCTCAFLLPLRYVFASVKQPLRQWACCGLGTRDGLAKCQLWQATKNMCPSSPTTAVDLAQCLQMVAGHQALQPHIDDNTIGVPKLYWLSLVKCDNTKPSCCYNQLTHSCRRSICNCYISARISPSQIASASCMKSLPTCQKLQ